MKKIAKFTKPALGEARTTENWPESETHTSRPAGQMMESRIMDELMKTAEYLKPDQLGIENRGLKAKN